MNFKNEYVSEQDIADYNLEAIQLRYRPGLKTQPIPFKYRWTKSLEGNVFLLRVRVGREEHSNRFTWVLSVDDVQTELVTDKSLGGSKKYSDVPYVIIWDLVDIKTLGSSTVEKNKLLDLFRSALHSYGDAGVNSFVEDVSVQFNF